MHFRVNRRDQIFCNLDVINLCLVLPDKKNTPRGVQLHYPQCPSSKRRGQVTFLESP